MKTVLLDTGPIIATLDSNDPQHALVRDRFVRLMAKVITTGAVLTEAMFFLQDLPNGPERLADWVDRIQTGVVDCFRPDVLREAAWSDDKIRGHPHGFCGCHAGRTRRPS